jgi:hypothetical protein
MSGGSPVDPIPVDWAVFRKMSSYENAQSNDLKVYVKPKVPSAKWVLAHEGNLIDDDTMHFYSVDDVYDQVENAIEEENLGINLIK